MTHLVKFLTVHDSEYYYIKNDSSFGKAKNHRERQLDGEKINWEFTLPG